jgi:hypothetical protein
LTDQGTGTFIIYSNPGIVRLTDLQGNTCHSEAGTVNRNEISDIGVEADGSFFINCEGGLAKNEPLEGGGYNAYGQGLPFINGQAHRAFIGSKRCVMNAFVFTPLEAEIRNVPKFYGNSAGVDVANNTVTPLTPGGVVSKITNGGETFLRAINGGTLPAGIPLSGNPAQSTAVYTRETGSFTKIFTLHATSADAVAGVGAINITDAGSGEYILYQPRFAGDLPRNHYLTKNHVATGVGNNICSGNLNYQTFNNTGLFTFDIIVTSGSNNGNFGLGVPGIATAATAALPGASLCAEMAF